MADKADGPTKRPSITDQEALQFHARGRPGKLEIMPTKPMATQRDLSLAYSPGVAAPVKAIAADPSTVFDYTTRGNMVSSMAANPIIFAMANPDPEITLEEAQKTQLRRARSRFAMRALPRFETSLKRLKCADSGHYSTVRSDATQILPTIR
jgi:malic enzyme